MTGDAAARALGSVIVPAWNEAGVIARTLDALFTDLDPSVRVIVACNGCTDDTAEVVRRSGHEVELLELGSVGKTGAIRAAEAIAPTGPRLYLDADITLPGRSANAVLALLAADAIAARPPARYQVGLASWPVRAYVSVRAELPSIRNALHGAGAYGLSTAARARFAEFPDVVADDLFADRVVDQEEVRIAECEPVVVEVPRTSRALVTTLARVYRGNQELAEADVARGASSTSRTVGELLHLARRPRWWPQIAAYVVLVSAGRLAARRSDGSWERDTSSRVSPAGLA
jgi:hypothetical protein